MTNQDDSYVYSGMSVSDAVVNRVIRRVLLVRGSKELFSDKERADDYLKELSCGRKPFALHSFKHKSKITEEIIAGLRCYRFLPPADTNNKKILIYIPGGAFARDPSTTHFSFTDKIAAATGTEALLILYPKIPEANCDTASNALMGLYSKLLKKYNGNNIYFLGDSAGASIMLSVVTLLRQNDMPLPRAMLMYSPFLDLSCTNKAIETIEKKDPMLGTNGLKLFVSRWTENDANSPLANPMNADLSALPDTYIFTGTRDILNPDVKLFAEKARKHGTKVRVFEFKNMYHCFSLYPLKSAKKVRCISCKVILSN